MAEGAASEGGMGAVRIQSVHLVEIRWFILLALLGAFLFPYRVGLHVAGGRWQLTPYLALGAMGILNAAYSLAEVRGQKGRDFVLPSLIADLGFVIILSHSSGGLSSPVVGALFLIPCLAAVFLPLRPSLGVLGLDAAVYMGYWVGSVPNARGQLHVPIALGLMGVMWGAGLALSKAVSMLPVSTAAAEGSEGSEGSEEAAEEEEGEPGSADEPQADEVGAGAGEDRPTEMPAGDGGPVEPEPGVEMAEEEAAGAASSEEAESAEEPVGQEPELQPGAEETEPHEEPVSEEPEPLPGAAAPEGEVELDMPSPEPDEAYAGGEPLDAVEADEGNLELDELAELRSELDETRAKLEALKSRKG